MAQSQAIPTEALADSGKPSFESVIALQSSSGFWSSASREVLARCLDSDQVDDPDVRSALEQLSI